MKVQETKGKGRFNFSGCLCQEIVWISAQVGRNRGDVKEGKVG